MAERYVVLDDDPTGTQAVQDVPVLLRWSPDAVRAALVTAPSVHLLTNARALDASGAEKVTFDAASTARLAMPDARIVLRGDSTLRGHLLAEYRAAARAAFAQREPVVMLVPALPAAGRVTLAGVHYAGSVPVHETAYARDGVFSYRSSRLLEWAEERTEGLLPADSGIEVPLHELRDRGSDAVLGALLEASGRERSAVVPDVETGDDLSVIADGARRAYELGLPLLIRSAPTFVGVLTGTGADGFAPPPDADDGLLVVCGSYVERTTEQLESLYEARAVAPIEVHVGALLGSPDDASAEVARAAQLADARLRSDGIAVLATPRHRPAGALSLSAGMRVAHGLAQVLPAMACVPGVVLAKGGITAHVTAASGLGCDRALVVGPIATGIARWRVSVDGRELDFVVFPGNVGDQDHLSAVVSLILDR
jgi:uncharacterized protein YgbK (DUF1537 family)